MEIKFNNYKLEDNLLNFTIKNNEFTGIISDNKNEIIDILKLNHKQVNTLLINNEQVQQKDLNTYKKKISFISSELDKLFFQSNVHDLIMYEIRRKKLIIKDLEKKIADSLRIVGLSTDLLIRNVYTLSSSEQKLLQIGISLISNPDILILDEPFISLDMKNEKKVIMLLQKIKEQYNKTIIIISNNSDILYKYTNNIIIIKNNKILIEGLTNEVFQRVDFLKRNKIQIPEIVEITYLAKKNKNIKIDYHKDIRDIIKDIYKHV
jgi:energy-coupling factor transporter ATP-binding protein EcfA2